MQHRFINQDGFLPEEDPLLALAKPFSAWAFLAQHLRQLLLREQLPLVLAALLPLPVEQLNNKRELEHAMLILSFIAHAYVWGSEQPANKLPAPLTLPWYQLSQCFGRAPVLS